MNKLVVICFFVFFSISENAQWFHRQFNVSNISELNHDQLNFALSKALKTIKIAEICSGVGVVLGITGGVLIADGINKSNNNTAILGGLPSDETGAGALILAGGIITEAIAIPLWITRSKRKAGIDVELTKYKQSGSALINGIGIKIRF
jgi:hypothetical protein